MSVKSLGSIGDLQLVSRHRLIDGVSPFQDTSPIQTAQKNEDAKPFVRDCGCVCRFTINSRKNPLRTAIRERKGFRFRGSIKNIQLNTDYSKNETKSKNSEESTNFTKLSSGTKQEMCAKDEPETQMEPTSTFSKNSTKWYESKYYFVYKTVPVSYRTTLIIPDSDEKQTYKEEIQFKTKIYLERVVENVTVNSHLPVYTSTLEMNINEHYLDLEPQQLMAAKENDNQSVLVDVDYGNSEC